LVRWGGLSFLAGAAIETCFVALVRLPALRGPGLTTFLAYFLIAAAAYALAAARLGKDRLSLPAIWAFAVLFRLTLLFTSPPVLSDDVYRHLWDGRLANAGINPYAHAVNSPLLDPLDSPLRARVNHNWMATPYLPTAQALSAVVYRIAPDSPLAFQIAAVFFDLLTGWLVVDMLGRLGLPHGRALIYLWNPLVCVEFAHAAHVDALMLFLVMAALRLLIAAWPGCGLSPRPEGSGERNRRGGWFALGSAVALAAATLTKGLPALLLPVVVRHWGWRNLLVYAGLIAAVCLLFAIGAGWGLAGPLDGEGLFGAIRIYTTYWNYNSGLYHWLEVGLSGYRTPGGVPPETVGWGLIRAAKAIVSIALGLVLGAVARWSWRSKSAQTSETFGTSKVFSALALVRLAAIPFAAYLLLATTIHPWYVTLVVPFLPFLSPREGEAPRVGRFLWPGLYFSLAVSLSYLTYADPDNLREYRLVRLVEYIPLYLLLFWAAWGYAKREA
jgi:hypothetical protein